MLPTVIACILVLITLVLLVAFVGVTWTGALLKKGQLFHWTIPYIKKIPVPFFRSLLTCHKCVAGQFALWLYITVLITFNVPFHILLLFGGVMWIMAVILTADILNKKLGYDAPDPEEEKKELERQSDFAPGTLKPYDAYVPALGPGHWVRVIDEAPPSDFKVDLVRLGDTGAIFTGVTKFENRGENVKIIIGDKEFIYVPNKVEWFKPEMK